MVPPLRRHLGDAVAAFGEVAPERVQVGGLRVPSGEADDGDRVVVGSGGGRSGDGPLGVGRLGGGPLGVDRFGGYAIGGGLLGLLRCA
ncbi:hypothetical protein GCM10009677_16110 [Sphaerisporangium rubeum]